MDSLQLDSIQQQQEQEPSIKQQDESDTDSCISSSTSSSSDKSSSIKESVGSESENESESEGVKVGNKKTPIKSKHEQEPPPVPARTSFKISPEAKLMNIGQVYSTIQDTLIVLSKERRSNTEEEVILDIGSLLALENREPLGEIFDTFGPITRPYYSVRFSTAQELQELGLLQQQPVCMVQEKAILVKTNLLRQEKGCDASNMFDEEVNDQEMEFSDDEKEKAGPSSVRTMMPLRDLDYQQLRRPELVGQPLARQPPPPAPHLMYE